MHLTFMMSGVELLFIGVPDFHSNGFKTHRIYKEVAKETGVDLS